MTLLEGLRAAPIHDDNLQLGCIRGALEYLGLDVSSAWLAGGTGHAFIIHITPGVCLGDVAGSVEDAYRDGTMRRLGRNLGYDLQYRFVSRQSPDFDRDRAQAWADLQESTEAGFPSYMYHNFCYQMIGGCGPEGLYFAADSFPHSNAGQGPVPLPEDGGFELVTVRPCSCPADDLLAVREGLDFALSHPDRDPANSGLQAYANWIESIRTAASTGTWRSIRAWHSCRSLAVDFLAEAEERIEADLGALFREARGHYATVATSLGAIAERSAAAGSQEVDALDRDLTLAQLGEAREAEALGLDVLRRLLDSLAAASTGK